MRIVLSAGDFSQSDNLKELGVELQNRGHTVTSFLGFGQNFLLSKAKAVEEASEADFVLVGMCDNNETDLAVCRAALGAEKPFGLLSTGYSSHLHYAYTHLREKARLVILSDEAAREETERLYPAAVVAVTGDPIWEQNVFGLRPREEVAATLGIKDKETIVLASLVREPIRDFLLATDLVEACILLQRKEALHPRIVFGLHPGDSLEGKARFRRLGQLLGEYGQMPVKVIDRDVDKLRTVDIVPLCDIMVSTFSSMSIAASMWGKPSIDYLHWDADEYLKKLYGEKPWRPTDVEGVSLGIRQGSASDLYREMKRLLTPEGYASQHEHQRRYYPRPERKGKIIADIATAVENLFR